MVVLTIKSTRINNKQKEEDMQYRNPGSKRHNFESSSRRDQVRTEYNATKTKVVRKS